MFCQRWLVSGGETLVKGKESKVNGYLGGREEMKEASWLLVMRSIDKEVKLLI